MNIERGNRAALFGGQGTTAVIVYAAFARSNVSAGMVCSASGATTTAVAADRALPPTFGMHRVQARQQPARLEHVRFNPAHTLLP
ncbi:hypothetical protein BOSEA31B_20859 [Hyphomicrobiales bacterium]|nr:hypothetical protein BOSEA31B_20859 [Hyphomicrobiales bacterium]CAH1702644.1 hypothetical protein BOSEA1005_30516 [Hyphomicrobiales bacterium]CAI0346833.1 hypothetical protein BO1005MUT1_530009 [Hyphomicrobiales bacterium]